MSEVQETSNTGGAPKSATEPFRYFIDHSERLRHLLHLSMRGISVLRGMPRIIEVLASINEGEKEDAQKRLESAKMEADLAQREVDEDFPLLTAQASIALWSALEATIRLFLVRWLQNVPEALEVDAIQKLRVRLGEYEQLKGEERFFYILDRLEQETSAPLKSGVSRFEVLLDLFGLGGTVEETDRRNLFELNQIRNSFAHRSGVVDKRLADACPWLALRVGEPVKVDRSMMDRFFVATANYTVQFIVRLGEKYGVDMNEFRKKASTQVDG